MTRAAKETVTTEVLQGSSPFTVLKWAALVFNALFALSFFAWFMHQAWTNPGWLIELARAHYAAVIGLPFAAFGALGVVVLVEFTHGRVEFNAVGLSFKGTAGYAVLWLLCFLGITVALRLLW